MSGTGTYLPPLDNRSYGHLSGQQSLRDAAGYHLARTTRLDVDTVKPTSCESSISEFHGYRKTRNDVQSIPNTVTSTSVPMHQPQPRWASMRSDNPPGLRQTLGSESETVYAPSDPPLLSAESETSSSRTSANTSRIMPSRTHREKLRIELAPDQPLTTQGKPRTRVYVACIQCRSRKIRCDGAKPTCHNCGRHPDVDGQCSYDPQPKRRGPDKTPGARHRTVVGIARVGDEPRRCNQVDEARRSDARCQRSPPLVTPSQRGNVSSVSDSDNDHYVAPTSVPLHSWDEYHLGGGLAMTGVNSEYVPNSHGFVDSTSSHTSVRQFISTSPLVVAHEGYHARRMLNSSIGAEPSLQYSRKSWWDTLISLCSIPQDHPYGQPSSEDTAPRSATVQHIVADLRFLFRFSTHWLSFLHAPRFFARIQDEKSRTEVQPSLVLGALAVATLLQSGDSGHGSQGRERALRLRDEAQSALEASLSTRWINEGLAQASCILVFFEFCAHPLHSMARVRSSLTMLDSLIRCLSLTSLDSDDPRAISYHARSAPTMPSSETQNRQRERPSDVHISLFSGQSGCTCSSYTLGPHWPGSMELTPLWSETPTWNSNWSESDIRREECRRLAWSGVMMAAAYCTYQDALNEEPTLDLFVMDPANFTLLLPGESLSEPRSSCLRETVWALYARSMLLWNSSIRMRRDSTFADVDKAQFTVAAWLELNVIEEALSRHICDVERTYLFVGREHLLNSRLSIYKEIERYIPESTATANIINRKKTEEWVTYQASMTKWILHGLQSITGQPTSNLAGCPVLLFWFMAELARMLTFYESDQSIAVALDASEALFAPIDYLMALWPCPEQHRTYEKLRCRFTSARSNLRAVQGELI